MRSGVAFEKVASYYSAKLQKHGSTPKGVDWNSRASQELRFGQLMRAVEHNGPRFSLNDYGCGYGALVSYLQRRGYDFDYRGFDISPAMIDAARLAHGGAPGVEFVERDSDLAPADVTVASGIFNVRLDTPEDAWTGYVLRTIDRLADLSTRSFSFNMLTSYSDPELMREDLFYADPRFIFHYCKTEVAREVALLHDYGLYEFTMIVRLA